MLVNEIEKIIKNLSFPLKSDKELELALKARLTKKELKLLKALAKNNLNDLQKQLQIDELSLKELKRKLIKKLNQERVKQSLYDMSKNEIKK